MILWHYNGRLFAKSTYTLRHTILLVFRYAVQHILQAVKIVMGAHEWH